MDYWSLRFIIDLDRDIDDHKPFSKFQRKPNKAQT